MGVFLILAIIIAGGIAVAVLLQGQRKPLSMRTIQGAQTNDVCLGCQGPLTSIGVEEFRIGGTSGGWKMLFGEWAELGEQKVPFDVFACQRCRRIELRVPA